MSIVWTPEQLDFLSYEAGRMLGVAVAGAGKTTVMIELIRRLLARGVPPEQILMTTFSKKGALDMRDRGVEMGVPADVEFRTLHSMGFAMVRHAYRRAPRKLRVPKDWMLVRVIRDYLEDIGGAYDEMGQELKVRDVLSEISLAQAALIFPGADNAWTAADGTVFPCYSEWAIERGIEPELARLIEGAYERLEAACRTPERYIDSTKGQPRWITFDQMLSVSARAILRQDERRDRWVRAFRCSFKYALVDEVQDNNLAQWTIVEYLSPDNLVAVGDDQQSIFGFRGAMPSLMRRFLNSGARLVTLTSNYRSGADILDAANKVLELAEDRLYEGGLVPGFPDRISRVSACGYDDTSDEGDTVANDIAELIEGGADPEGIAVLYRLNASSGPVEMGLLRRGIRYRVAGSSFFRKKVVKAAIGYLACALDENSEQGWGDCYAIPLRGIGRSFLSSFPTAAAARGCGRNARRAWYRGSREALAVIDRVRALIETETTVAALQYLFEDVGLREFCRDEGANVEDETETDEACRALVDAAGALHAADLVSYAQDMTGVAYEDHDQDAGPSCPMVTLSTVHKSKGLQWDTVFAIGMSSGLFPFLKGDPQEELRLAYVAMTRPRFGLNVSWTEDGEGPSRVGELVSVYVNERYGSEGAAA